MHSEQTSHDAAGCSCAKLPSCSGADEFLKFVFEETEVQAEDYQHDTQYDSHCRAFDTVQQSDGNGGEDRESGYDGQQAFPVDILHILDHYHGGRSK